MSAWTVYLLRCADDTLYTGITTDLEKRIAAHNAKTGAKYTRSRTPVELVWSQGMRSEGGARKREMRIKKLSRAEKEKMVAGEGTK